MRWSPSGREGIEDRRAENQPKRTPEERRGTLLEGLPTTEHESVMYRRRLHDLDNYKRRTAGEPEVPYPPDIAPATVQHSTDEQPPVYGPPTPPDDDVDFNSAIAGLRARLGI